MYRAQSLPLAVSQALTARRMHFLVSMLAKASLSKSLRLMVLRCILLVEGQSCDLDSQYKSSKPAHRTTWFSLDYEDTPAANMIQYWQRI